MKLNQHVNIQLPGSKSISHRALILAYLNGIPFENIYGISDSRDTQLLTTALNRLESDVTLEIPQYDFLDAGTPSRFFLALAVATKHNCIITGNSSLKNRSIQSLVDSLSLWGGSIEFLEKPGFFPVKIQFIEEEEVNSRLSPFENTDSPLPTIPVDRSISSQFVSALMLISTTLLGKFSQVELELTGHVHSDSYIEMTASVMRDFGYSVELQNNSITVSGYYNGCDSYTIEADWSSLSYFLNQLIVQSNAQALAKADSNITANDSTNAFPYSTTTITVLDSTTTQSEMPIDSFKLFFARLKNPSNQGDSNMLKFYSQLGLDFEFDSNGLWAWNRSSNSNYELIHKDSTEQMIDWDLSDIPDTVPSLVVALTVLKKTAYLRNIHNLIFKESNRIDVLNENIHRLGFELVQDIQAPNNYTLQPMESLKNQHVNSNQKSQIPHSTHSDHRMAMAFASILNGPQPESVDDSSCVEKSFPNFWQELQKMVG